MYNKDKNEKTVEEELKEKMKPVIKMALGIIAILLCILISDSNLFASAGMISIITVLFRAI